MTQEVSVAAALELDAPVSSEDDEHDESEESESADENVTHNASAAGTEPPRPMSHMGPQVPEEPPTISSRSAMTRALTTATPQLEHFWLKAGNKRNEMKAARIAARSGVPWDTWRRQAIRLRKAGEKVVLPHWDSEEWLSSPWMRHRKPQDAYNVYVEVFD